MKRCSKCGSWKTFGDFYEAAGMRDGFRSDCKACNLAAKAARYRADPEAAKRRVRAWQINNYERYRAAQNARRGTPEGKRALREGHPTRKFGITIADYERLLQEQDGGCAICGAPPPENGSLHVDHDHDTGAVRGLLCVRCNNGLGQFGESIEMLMSAIAYLEGARG
jgi:hypothetical protein